MINRNLYSLLLSGSLFFSGCGDTPGTRILNETSYEGTITVKLIHESRNSNSDSYSFEGFNNDGKKIFYIPLGSSAPDDMFIQQKDEILYTRIDNEGYYKKPEEEKDIKNK